MLKTIYITFIITFLINLLYGQDGIFHGLINEELLSELVVNYKPDSVLTYADTRDSMYRNVYLQNGSGECYYTGRTIELPIDVDPSAFLNNYDDPIVINTEHIYPQSKGAREGFARRDMHHLIPVIRQANEARSNYTFAEIDDNDTDRWFYKTDIFRNTPLDDKSLFSEVQNGGFGNIGRFEPRESVKGDVARAVFYFYTMYREEADAEDPEYFHLMKDQLYEWHLNDPSDSLEIVRNELKAAYQEGKVNPYIIDCSLVGRAFFDSGSLNCSSLLSTSSHELPFDKVYIYPNPVKDFIFIEGINKSVTVRVINPIGKIKLFSNSDNEIRVTTLPSGLYFLQLLKSNNDHIIVKRFIKK